MFLAFNFEYGKDPLSVRDKIISEREKALEDKIREIDGLRRAQEEDYVPRVTKEKIEENLKILEVWSSVLEYLDIVGKI